MRIEFRPNLQPFLSSLQGLKSDKLPRITASAINLTLGDARSEIQATMQRVFVGVTPWTLRGVRIRRATRGDLRGEVYIDDEAGKGVPASRFVLAEVYGGDRRYKRFERALQSRGLLPAGMYVVPTKAAPIDAYGNVPGNFIVRVLAALQSFTAAGYSMNMNRDSRARKRLTKQGISYFAGSPGRGMPMGIWERRSFAQGKAVRPIFLFVKRATYRKRLPFHEVAQAVFDSRFALNFDQAFRFTLKGGQQ